MNIAKQLNPEAHGQFLNVLFATADNLVRTADGEQLQVIGHYRKQWEEQKRTLNAGRRRPAGPTKRNA